MIVNIKPPDRHVNKINKPRRKLDSFDKLGIFAVVVMIACGVWEVLR